MDRIFEKEIMEVLYKFQKGYTERNLENVDAYTEELFTKDADLRVMGTSPGEICLGFEETKELIEGDWKYWGDVSCDLNNPIIMNLNEDIALIALKGSVKIDFKFDSEKLESQKEFIFEQIDFENLDSSELKNKTVLLNWMLTQWGIGYSEKNEQFIPLRVTGLLKKHEGKWKFKQMKFSVSSLNVPDYLFDRSADDSKAKEQLKNFQQNCYGETAEIKGLLSTLQNHWNENDFNGTDMFNKIFDKDNSLLICPDGNIVTQKEEFIDKLNNMKGVWNEINLDTESSVINTENNTGWALTLGTVKTKISREKLLQSLLNESKNILESKGDVKQKHLTILRHISSVFMIENLGEDFEIPVRIETVFSKDNSWKIKYIQISYGYEWIYEHRTEKLNLWGK
ncbi:hypothetical protein [Oceanirhabdus seepicola]|uniref:SnoaL-like domain-containing protein n=1 Tax=Oceanirhabdus seepicola TaxID=2828781 RepID=A0A9J6P3L2_9CLOT|nr:hypothetical protein [Oceanirhabdus seepicola]MCM1991255.1 hypothetical protein [Oceanirhabdus seepicola]